MNSFAVIYERVSTFGQSVENQTPEILLAVKRDGLTVQGEYVERVSGWNPKAKRPALDRLLSDAQAGKLRGAILYVWALSRLSRQGLEHVVRLMAILKQCGVALVSVSEGLIDTRRENPYADIVLALFATMARMLSEERSRATRAGLERWKAMGGRPGRQPVKLDLDELRRLRSTGMSLRQLARRFGCSVGVVHQRLHPESITPAPECGPKAV